MGTSAAAASPPDRVLHVSGLGKEYRLYPSPRARLKALLTGASTHRSHWALRKVSFDLHRGQCIGVIGDNGAGKSTLLKLLAGTLQPSCGVLERAGRVTAILELGAGFHPEFSGRDNLYFGGSLIGIAPQHMQALEPEIAAFAELGQALERPVKTYSSGMVVRLAFALVTAVQPDVLIIDEALAVGDQPFQQKCIERITAFRENGCTILFCSHSQYHIRHLCDAALWLRNGEMAYFGSTEAALAAYGVHTRERQEKHAGAQTTGDAPAPAALPPPSASKAADQACLISVEIKDLADPVDGHPGELQSQDLVVTITARGCGDECPHMGFMIEQSKGVGITSIGTHEDGACPRRLPDGTWQTVLTFPDLPLHSGDYVISAFLFDETGLVVYDEWFQFLHLRFIFPKPLPGLVRLPHHWS